MTIEKRGKKFRIKQMVDGQVYRITLDHRPTNAEAMRLISEQLERTPRKTADMTFRKACDAYIASKENILSPTTKREYLGYVRNIPVDFLEKRVMQITALNVQKFINDYSATRSPKTTANMAHFVMGVLHSAEVDVKAPQLPQKEKKSPYIPSKEEVRAVMKQIEGTKYEVPIMLAAFGLRRSEICALTLDDLDGNVLTINKAKVQNADKEWVTKKTKTVESTRTVVIPESLADKIREQGYVYQGDPGMIYKHLQKAQKAAGVPPFQLHKLRHFFASYMHDMGYTDKQIQEAGGWKTDNVMKTVYQHAMELDEAKKNMAKDLGTLLG